LDFTAYSELNKGTRPLTLNSLAESKKRDHEQYQAGAEFTSPPILEAAFKQQQVHRISQTI
jgi:hypothetical protein